MRSSERALDPSVSDELCARAQNRFRPLSPYRGAEPGPGSSARSLLLLGSGLWCAGNGLQGYVNVDFQREVLTHVVGFETLWSDRSGPADLTARLSRVRKIHCCSRA